MEKANCQTDKGCLRKTRRDLKEIGEMTERRVNADRCGGWRHEGENEEHNHSH